MGEEGEKILAELPFRVLGKIEDVVVEDELTDKDSDEELSSRSSLYQLSRKGPTTASQRRQPFAASLDSQEEFVALAHLMASRAKLDASVSLLSRVLVPPRASGEVEERAPQEDGGEDGDSPNFPGLLPAHPSFILLWLIIRVGCPHSPLRPVDGYTPLHLAACLGLLDETVALLSSGADANAISLDGATPLSVALDGKRGCGLHADFTRTRYNACTAALQQAGGLANWGEALKFRIRGTASELRETPKPPGMGVFLDWGVQGVEMMERFMEACTAEVIERGGSTATQTSANKSPPPVEDGTSGGGADEWIGASFLDVKGTLSEGTPPLAPSATPSTASITVRKIGAEEFTHITLDSGGGGIIVEGAMKNRKGNKGGKSQVPSNHPNQFSPAGLQSVGMPLPVSKGTTSSSTDTERPLRSRATGAIGEKFLNA